MATVSGRAEPGLVGGKRKPAHFEDDDDDDDDDEEELVKVAAFCGSVSASSPKGKARRISPSPSYCLPSRPPENYCPRASDGMNVKVDVCGEDQEYSSHEPLHDHGLLVVTLGFLADAEAPSELLEISKSSKSFRAAALDNILWREMCDQKWKTKFGYRFRMERAKKDVEEDAADDSEFDLLVSSSSEIRPYPTATSDDIDCPKAGFWYHRYWKELKMSTVNRITLSDLREWQWSACRWFMVPKDDDEPTVLQSGMWEAYGNGLQFLEDNTVSGGNQVPLYRIEQSGSVVNTAIDEDNHSPTWAFHVHRLSNWGWELRSQCLVLRPYQRENELEELWVDYQDELIHQDKEDGVPITRKGAEETTSRIVPRSMADKLRW